MGRFRGSNNRPGDFPGQDAGQEEADQQKSGGQHPQFAANGLHCGGNGRYQRIEHHVVFASVFQRGPLNGNQIFSALVIHRQGYREGKALPVEAAVPHALHGEQHKILPVRFQLLGHTPQIPVVQVMNDAAERDIGAVDRLHAFIHHQHAQAVILSDALDQRIQVGVVNVSGDTGRHVLKGAPLFVAIKLIQQLNLQQPQKSHHQHDKEKKRPADAGLDAQKALFFPRLCLHGGGGRFRFLLFQSDTLPLAAW